MISVAPAGAGFVACPTTPGCASLARGYLLIAAARLTSIYFTASDGRGSDGPYFRDRFRPSRPALVQDQVQDEVQVQDQFLSKGPALRVGPGSALNRTQPTDDPIQLLFVDLDVVLVRSFSAEQ